MKEAINYYSKVEGMLGAYTQLSSEIKNLELDIEELEHNYRGVGSIGYEERTGQTYKFNSSVENEVTSRDGKLKHLKDLKRSKEIKVEKVKNALEILNDKEMKIIELKYFSERKKSWTNVSRKMDMCEAWCRTLKDRAIKKMVPIIFISEDTNIKVAK